MKQIESLAGKKGVILISHRLANVVNAGNIYVMNSGVVAESGTHEQLVKAGGEYAKLWDAQMSLENYGLGGAQ